MADAAARQRRAVQALHDPALARARARAARLVHEQRKSQLSPPKLTPHSPDRASAHSPGETPSRPASQRLQPSPAKRKNAVFGASEYGRAFRELVEHRSPQQGAAATSPDIDRLREGGSHATWCRRLHIFHSSFCAEFDKAEQKTAIGHGLKRPMGAFVPAPASATSSKHAGHRAAGDPRSARGSRSAALQPLQQRPSTSHPGERSHFLPESSDGGVPLTASARAVLQTGPSATLPPVNRSASSASSASEAALARPSSQHSPSPPRQSASALAPHLASGAQHGQQGSGVSPHHDSPPGLPYDAGEESKSQMHIPSSDHPRSVSHGSALDGRRRAQRIKRKELMPTIAQLAKMLPQSQLPHLTPFRLRELGVARKTHHTSMNDVQDVVAARWAVASTVYGDAASEMLWSRLNKKYTQDVPWRGSRRTSGAGSTASLASSVTSRRSRSQNRSRRSHRDLPGHSDALVSNANTQFDERRYGVLPNMWDTVAPQLPPPEPAAPANVALGVGLGAINKRSRKHIQHSTAPSQNESLRAVLSTKRVVPLVYSTKDPNLALQLKREQQAAEAKAEQEAEALLERMLAEQAAIEDTGYMSALGEDDMDAQELYIPVLEGENIGGAPSDSDSSSAHPPEESNSADERDLQPWNQGKSKQPGHGGDELDTSRDEEAVGRLAADSARVAAAGSAPTGLGSISHSRSAAAAKRRKARRKKPKKRKGKAHVGGLLVSPYGNVWLEDACLWPHSEDVLLPSEGGPTDRDRLVAKKRKEEIKRQRAERAKSIREATRGRKYAQQHQPVLAAAAARRPAPAARPGMPEGYHSDSSKATSVDQFGRPFAPQLQQGSHWPPPSEELDVQGQPRERRFVDDANRVREIQFYDEAGEMCEIELYDEEGALREHVFLDEHGDMVGLRQFDEDGETVLEEGSLPMESLGDDGSAPSRSLEPEKQETLELALPSVAQVGPHDAHGRPGPPPGPPPRHPTAGRGAEHSVHASPGHRPGASPTQASMPPQYTDPRVQERREQQLERARHAQRWGQRPPLLPQLDWEPSPAPSYMLHSVKERSQEEEAEGDDDEGWSDSSQEKHEPPAAAAVETAAPKPASETSDDDWERDSSVHGDEDAKGDGKGGGASAPKAALVPAAPVVHLPDTAEPAPLLAEAQITSEFFGRPEQEPSREQQGTDVPQELPTRSVTADYAAEKPPTHRGTALFPAQQRPATEQWGAPSDSLPPTAPHSSLGRRMRAASPRFLDIVDRVMTPRGRSVNNDGLESARSMIPGGRTPLSGEQRDAFAPSLQAANASLRPKDSLTVRLAHRGEDSQVSPLRQGRAPSAAGSDIAKYHYSQHPLQSMPGLNASQTLEAVLQSAPHDVQGGAPAQQQGYDSDGTLSVVSAASSVNSADALKHLETIEHSHAAISAETLAGVVEAIGNMTAEDIDAFVSTKPTQDITVVAAALCVLLQVKEPSWKRCRRIIRKDGFLDKLALVAPTMLSKKARKAARRLLRQHSRHLHNLRVDKLTQGLLEEADKTQDNRATDPARLLGSVLHSWCVCMAWYNPSKAKSVPASGLGSMSGLQLDPDVLQAFADQGFERPEEAATAAAAAAALEMVNGKTLEQAMKKFGFYLSPELLDRFEHHFSALRAARRKRRQAKGGAGAGGGSKPDHGPTMEESAGALSLEQDAQDKARQSLESTTPASTAVGAGGDSSDEEEDLDEDTLSWQKAIFSADAARRGKPPKLLAAREAFLGVDYNAFSHLQHSDPTVQPVAVAAACLCIVFGRTPCWREAKALFADAKNTMHALVSLQRRELPLRRRMLLACIMRSRSLMEMHPAKYFLTGVVLAVFFNWLRAYISTPTLPADKIFVPRSARLQGVEYGRSIAKQRQALGQMVKGKDGAAAEEAGGFQGKVSEAWENLNLDSVPPLLPPQLTGRMLHLLAALGAKNGASHDTIHIGVSQLAAQAALRAGLARARTRLNALDKLQSLKPSDQPLPSLHPLNRARRGLLELDPVDILLFRKQEAPLALECAAIAGALCCVLGLNPDWNTVSQILADPQATRNLALLEPSESGHHDGHVQAHEVLHANSDTLWPAIKYSRYKAALRLYRWLCAFLDEAMEHDEAGVEQ